MTEFIIGAVCVALALVLEVGAYRQQIRKTKELKKSKHVSTTALMMRLAKYMLTLIAVALFENWVAFGMQAVALIACAVTLHVVAKHKPKGWKLWG